MVFHRSPSGAEVAGRVRLPWLCVLFASVLLAAPGATQSPCDVLLPQAEASYVEARFDDVPRLVEGCLKAKPTRRQRADAYALLARSHVMADRFNSARQAIGDLLRIDPDFEPDTRRDPLRFVRLFEEVKLESAIPRVASVSKTEESLAEAPATVVVVTAEDIRRRGYLDLVEMLHDLPGFDISRGSGALYAHAYQRGLRSDLNTRTLLLVDGIEENELFSQMHEIGPQIPLSNIDRVEVIYGPASTMYGPSAFAGVINIITKDPGQLLREGESYGASVVTAAGDLGTRYVDATVAGQAKSGFLSWSLTSRLYHSDDSDIGRSDDWNFDPADFDKVDYQGLLRIAGSAGVAEFEEFLAAHPEYACAAGDPDCIYRITDTSVELTEAGARLAAELDKSAYAQELQGRPVGFSNDKDSEYVDAKLRVVNLRLGFIFSHRDDSAAGWYNDLAAPGGDNGSIWDSQKIALYAKYSRSVGRDTTLNFFGQYKRHRIDDGTVLTFLSSYSRGILDLENLAAATEPRWAPGFLFSTSSQTRVEMSTVYDPSKKFNAVSGVEIRSGSIQRDFVASAEPNPSEGGVISGGALGGDNHLDTTDLGVFAQVSYKPVEQLKIVLGGRYDHNKVRRTLGYGSVFVPRVALVYTPRDFVFKAIYSEAFQPAGTAQLFSTRPSRFLPSPDLEPEIIKNYELSASWRSGNGLTLEISPYESNLSDVIQLVIVPCEVEGCPTSTTLGFRGLGAFRVRGVQATASWERENHSLLGNYTYTDPINTNPVNVRDPDRGPLLDDRGIPIDELPVGDIANHQVNLQYNVRFKEKLNLNLRAGYVGTKKTGKNTTVSANRFDEIGSYVLLSGALTYEDLYPRLLPPGDCQQPRRRGILSPRSPRGRRCHFCQQDSPVGPSRLCEDLVLVLAEIRCRP